MPFPDQSTLNIQTVPRAFPPQRGRGMRYGAPSQSQQRPVPAFLQQQPRPQRPQYRQRIRSVSPQTSQRREPPAFLQPQQFPKQQISQSLLTPSTQNQQDLDISMSVSPTPSQKQQPQKQQVRPQFQQRPSIQQPKQQQKPQQQPKLQQQEYQPKQYQKPKQQVQSQKDEEYDEEYYDQEDEYYGEEEETQQPQSKIKKPFEEQKSKQVCYKYQIGKCIFGDKCRNLHIKDDNLIPKSICRDFLAGICKEGEKCINLHDITKAKQISQGVQNLQAQYQTIKKTSVDEEKKIEDQDEEQQMTQEEMKKFEEFKQQVAEKNKGKDLRSLLMKEKNVQPLQIQIQKEYPEQKQEKRISPAISILQKQDKEEEKSLIPKKILSSKKPLALRKASSLSDKVSQIETQEEIDNQIIIKKREEIFDRLGDIKKNPSKYEESYLGKASLLKMCNDDEIQRRGYIEQNAASNFELESQGKNFNQLAIKEYSRSAADKVMNDPNNIRHPVVLYLTVKYLRDCIADQDKLSKDQSDYKYYNQERGRHSFADIYNFIRDRGRSIIQDFIIIKDKTNVCFIRSLEELNRFFILSYHDGFNNPSLELHQNTEQLTKNLGELKECYQSVKLSDLEDGTKKDNLKNEAEFLSYLIIACSEDHILAQQDITNIDLSQYDEKGQILIKEAIHIHNAISQRDISMFFKLYNDTNYFFACLMTNFLNMMRFQTLTVLQMASQKVIEYSFIKKKLCFSNTSDTIKFIEVCGFTNMGDKGFSIKERKPYTDYIESYKKWKQRDSLKILDDKKEKRFRCDLMELGIEMDEITKFKEKYEKQKQERAKLELQERERQAKEKLQKIREQQAEQERLRLQQEEEEKRKEIERQQQLLEQEKEKLINEITKINDMIKAIDEKQHSIKKNIKSVTLKIKTFKMLKYNKIANKETKKSFFSLWKQKAKNITKKKIEKIKKTNIYEQIKELSNCGFVLPQSLNLVNSFGDTEIYDVSMLETFTFNNWVQQNLKVQEGQFNLLLLSSEINSIRVLSDSYYRQYLNVLTSLISLLTDQNKTLYSPSKDNFITYEHQIKDNLQYNFNFRCLDQDDSLTILGTSLLMFITNEVDLFRDLNILRNQLQKVCNWSKVNVILIIHSNQKKSDDEINKDVDKLYYCMESRVIGNFEKCKVLLQTPSAKKKNHKFKLKDETFQQIVFSQIQDNLKESISQSLLVKNVQPTFYNLNEIITYFLNDLIKRKEAIEQGVEEEQIYLNYLHFIKSQNIGIEDIIDKNEIQVLNLWLNILKTMLKPLKKLLKQEIKRLMIDAKDEKIYNDNRPAINNSLSYLSKLLIDKDLSYPLQYNENFKHYHVTYCIMSQIDNLLFNKEDISELSQKIAAFNKTAIYSFNENFNLKRGTKLFMIILDYILERIKVNDQKFIIPISDINQTIPIVTIQSINYEDIVQKLKQQEEQNKDNQYLKALEKQFPQDFSKKWEIPAYIYSQAKIIDVQEPNKISSFEKYMNILSTFSKDEKEKQIINIEKRKKFFEQMGQLNAMLYKKLDYLDEEGDYTTYLGKRIYSDVNSNEQTGYDENNKRQKIDSIDISEELTVDQQENDKDYGKLILEILDQE